MGHVYKIKSPKGKDHAGTNCGWLVSHTLWGAWDGALGGEICDSTDGVTT